MRRSGFRRRLAGLLCSKGFVSEVARSLLDIASLFVQQLPRFHEWRSTRQHSTATLANHRAKKNSPSLEVASPIAEIFGAPLD